MLTGRPAIGLSVLIAASAVLALVLHFHEPHQGPAGPPIHAASKIDVAVDARVKNQQVVSARPTPNAAEPSPPSTNEHLPEGARGEEDAAWLTRHGYPTHEELHEAFVEGPPAASTIPSTPQETAAVALALSNSATRDAAEASLRDAAMLGDIYALVAMGLHLEPTSPVPSQGYFRAAIMRGDWMVSVRFKPPLDTLQDAMASMFALRLLEDFDAERRRRGLPPLRRELRPGMDEFMITLSVLEEAYGEP